MITASQLETLLTANAVKNIEIKAIDSGFSILIDNIPLEAKRGHVRTFKQLQSVANFLHSKGVGKFTVNLALWNPKQDSMV